MTRANCCRWLSTLLLLAGGAVTAAPVPAGLSIQASVTLDTTNSVATVGDATQSGSLSAVSGGAAAGTSTFGDDPSAVTPSSGQAAALVATGDGVGATLQMAGTFGSTSTDAMSDGLFVDYVLDLFNSSATDTFDVTFRVLWTNTVAASGPDAFTHSQLSVFDASNNEVFYTDYTADTVNGDTAFDIGGDTFMVSLAPGASYSFTALQQQRGGAFVDTSGYSASLVAFLQLDGVVVTGQPPTGAPLPGTLALAGLGLALLARSRRRA